MQEPYRTALLSANYRTPATGRSWFGQQRPLRSPLRLQLQRNNPVCEPKWEAQRNMPIDRSSIAFAGSIEERSYCGGASYQGGQVFLSPAIYLCSFGGSGKVIDDGLRPDRLSRASGSVISGWWRCLPTRHGACEFARVAIIKIGSGHVGPHDRRPDAYGWIACREYTTWRHRR